MKEKKEKNRREGFTLAELLVVVAIIGILVAVSIPIFTSQLEKARLATCLANRRSLLAEVRVKALDSDLDQEAAFNALYPANKADFPCPKGGVFSWKNGKIICSVHDGTGEPSASTVNIGGQTVTITAKLNDNYKLGDTASYYEGNICLVGDSYYYIRTDQTNIPIPSSYSSYEQWFNDNMINGQAAVKINTSSIKEISKKSVQVNAGDLYVDTSTKYVYIVNGIHYLSSKTDKSHLPIFGKIQ
jgi:prepilin-type N-terminal cleavage/methylation domain-containing protein